MSSQLLSARTLRLQKAGQRAEGSEVKRSLLELQSEDVKDSGRKQEVKGQRQGQRSHLSCSPSSWSSCWVMAATSSQQDNRVPVRSNHWTSGAAVKVRPTEDLLKTC